MVKTYLYLPEELNKKITHESLKNGKNKADTIRKLINIGLESTTDKNKASINVMLKIKTLGQKHGLNMPKDLSANLDNYLWEN